MKSLRSGDDPPDDGTTPEGGLSYWIVGSLCALVLIPTCLYVGYAVLAPAKAAERVEIASRFDVGEAAYIH